uniref:Uncharacterized protein n=1 Tax=Candidatus Kentrum sp. FW TaxID=2126338 RepID=A0A450STT8_9GAMM|nr:MAG: hypothetical protein BECKFW1821B_GA0114236_10342 [Candidatus Kentron sp. FW]
MSDNRPNHNATSRAPRSITPGTGAISPTSKRIAPSAETIAPDTGSITPYASTAAPDANSIALDSSAVAQDTGSIVLDGGVIALDAGAAVGWIAARTYHKKVDVLLMVDALRLSTLPAQRMIVFVRSFPSSCLGTHASEAPASLPGTSDLPLLLIRPRPQDSSSLSSPRSHPRAKGTTATSGSRSFPGKGPQAGAWEPARRLLGDQRIGFSCLSCFSWQLRVWHSKPRI